MRAVIACLQFKFFFSKRSSRPLLLDTMQEANPAAEELQYRYERREFILLYFGYMDTFAAMADAIALPIYKAYAGAAIFALCHILLVVNTFLISWYPFRALLLQSHVALAMMLCILNAIAAVAVKVFNNRGATPSAWRLFVGSGPVVYTLKAILACFYVGLALLGLVVLRYNKRLRQARAAPPSPPAEPVEPIEVPESRRASSGTDISLSTTV